MPLTFVTLGAEFEEPALAFVAKLRQMGARVQAEFDDGSTPRTPTILGTIGSSRHYADVVSKVDMSVVSQWVSYCKCRSNETYYSLVLPATGREVAASTLVCLRNFGVGVYVCDADNLSEIVGPRDLSLNLSLPDLSGEKKALRVALAGVYAKFDRGDWFDGFKDACQLLEAKARKALVNKVRAGSVSFAKNGSPKTYSMDQIGRQTLGQLAYSYSEIVLPTGQEQIISRALGELNPDRVGAVHRTNDGRVRGRLRKKVGVHMWMLIKGLRELEE